MADVDAKSQIGRILETIRKTEGGAYNDPPNTPGGASGGYQFIRSTWVSNGGSKYAPEAYLATKAQQDEIAAQKVNGILTQTAGKSLQDQLSAVAQIWYLGHIATASELDRVPRADAGNKLTVRQYTEKWLSIFGASYVADGSPLGPVADAASDLAGKVVSAITGVIGDAVEPFAQGLRRLSIIGFAVLLGVGLVGSGAWRSVKPPADARG